MLSDKSTVCPFNLLDIAHQKRGAKAAIVNAGKRLPMLSIMDCVKEKLIIPVFIGDEKEIKKTAEELKFDISEYEIINEPVENNTAKIAAKLAGDGKVKIIVKGHIHTDILMKEVLLRKYNLIGKKRLSHISWIPFKSIKPMYRKLEQTMYETNQNHFGFDNMQITEQAQYTEYLNGGFYEWHTDNGINFMNGTSPVRKISMSLLLNHESEFDGGDLELCEEGKVAPLKQGHAIFFASFLNHRVKPVTRGTRKSLVMWFGGTPFK